MTGSSLLIRSHEDSTSYEYFQHSAGQRVNTDVVLVEALRKQYPNLELIVSPQGLLNLIGYASAGFANAIPLNDHDNDPVFGAGIRHRAYFPPARRLDNGRGAIVDQVIFGKYMYKWKDIEFLLYIANGRDGGQSYPSTTNHYILTRETHKVDELIKQATIWGGELHNETWVFDRGYWQKSRELWEAAAKAQWSDVILEEGMKKAIISDVENFFDGRETYNKLKVPWKRGIIYYGPPGNGKTISIKAMMHALYQRGTEKGDNRLTVPTLYVRTLSSFGGPEYSLNQIFSKAREEAPCYLVFEDLDSIVRDSVRSYFLNEVDGLKSNDGILMVGSTNHLDRLDPGISKRPSRFDRKYYFPDPDLAQRAQYAKYWQGKLSDNKEIDFPDRMCSAVAEITKGFSFAYLQEAFVASLLAIAVQKEEPACANGLINPWAGPEDPLAVEDNRLDIAEDGGDDLKDVMLWQELKKQIRILRQEMDEGGNKDVPTSQQQCMGIDEQINAMTLQSRRKDF